MAENDSDFDDFLKYHVRMGPYYDREECRKTCKENLLCSLVRKNLNIQIVFISKVCISTDHFCP
jgi:hypothetical protein